MAGALGETVGKWEQANGAFGWENNIKVNSRHVSLAGECPVRSTETLGEKKA